MFNKFMPGDHEEDPIFHPRDPNAAGETTNLADLILEKIAAHEAAEARGMNASSGPAPIDDDYELPPKVVEVYTQ